MAGAWRQQLGSLPRRAYLTYRHRGLRALAYRALVFPLRATPLDRLLELASAPQRSEAARTRAWYEREGRPVTVVIPSYRDAGLVAALTAAIRRTTPAGRVRIVVADDHSGPEHLAALAAIEGIEVVPGERNGGFSVNANRGLRAADPRHDVVLLNSDVVPMGDWLACLQYATREERVGIAGPMLLYPDNRIQYGGTIRNQQAPEWFDHRYRFRPARFGPANVPGPTLAATGACMYLTRRALDRVGLFDEDYPMAYEDVDYCLRAWQAGFEVHYAPTARLHHHESITRGTQVGERERASQRVFWRRWGSFLDERRALTDDGRLRVVYVTEDTFAGGGHRVVFEHLNGLAERGHDVQLWTLGPEPGWFELRCPVRRFASFEDLVAALAPLPAFKVATWWRTATPVWRASVVYGLPVYLVQDIETSYYPRDRRLRDEVLNAYRPEFSYLTTSRWNRERLRELGIEAALVSPGVDLGTFHPLGGARRGDMLLALGRSERLKNLPLTIAAWRSLEEPRPELCLFGSEPELGRRVGARYVVSPSDPEVNRLHNEATVFVQTSLHEGFCLPILESMATGGAVVCTDADGNRDFCVDGENCLMVDAQPGAVAAAIARLLHDPGLCRRLGDAGLATAAEHGWPARVAALESLLFELARPRATAPSTDAVPGTRPGVATGPRPPEVRSG